jgi:hypothetical protein
VLGKRPRERAERWHARQQITDPERAQGDEARMGAVSERHEG